MRPEPAAYARRGRPNPGDGEEATGPAGRRVFGIRRERRLPGRPTRPMASPASDAARNRGLGSARLGSARLGSARLGSARLGSARLGSARLGSARLGSARLGSARLGSMLAATLTSCAPNHRPVSNLVIAVSMTCAGCRRSRVESSSSASPARAGNHPGQFYGIIQYFVLNVRVEIRFFHVVFIKFRRFRPAGEAIQATGREAMRGEPRWIFNERGVGYRMAEPGDG